MPNIQAQMSKEILIYKLQLQINTKLQISMTETGCLIIWYLVLVIYNEFIFHLVLEHCDLVIHLSLGIKL